MKMKASLRAAMERGAARYAKRLVQLRGLNDPWHMDWDGVQRCAETAWFVRGLPVEWVKDYPLSTLVDTILLK